MTKETWTIREAAELLVPRIGYRTLDDWIRHRLRPVGVRRTGKIGRPAHVFDADEVRELHAELLARRRQRLRETDP